MARSLLGWPGAPLAHTSAALFGASTPFAKLLLGESISPWLLAGLLYLGSGIGLSAVHLGRHVFSVASAVGGLVETPSPTVNDDTPNLRTHMMLVPFLMLLDDNILINIRGIGKLP